MAPNPRCKMPDSKDSNTPHGEGNWVKVGEGQYSMNSLLVRVGLAEREKELPPRYRFR